jgi:hypothetical protein
LWAFLFCPNNYEPIKKVERRGGFKMVNHAALASSYDRGNHFAYGHFKRNDFKKVQHLESVPAGKKEHNREDYYDKRDTDKLNPFKTYSKKDIEKHHEKAKEAELIYTNWRHDLAESSADFIYSLKGDLKESAETTFDTYKEEVYESLGKLLIDLKNNLETLLVESPPGLAKKQLKSAQQLLETVKELLWHQIEKIVKEHVPCPPDNSNGDNDTNTGIEFPQEEENPSVVDPPSGSNPITTPAPYHVFSTGSFKMEVKVGSLTSEIKFADPNKQSEGTTMFYIVDGYGSRKAVDIKFSNEGLQKLFEDRIKNSKVYKKEISLERFNAVLKKIEALMKELASIDPERLKSKVHGEKEIAKFNNVIDKFTDFFYSIRK